jgi:hypothetical protein
MIIIPKLVVSVRYNFSLIYISMDIKYDPNPAPNKVFTHQILGIEYPLTSLFGRVRP